MEKILKIVYCNPTLHALGGGERVLTVKANYFVENLKYEVHIIVTDGKNLSPIFPLHPLVKVHQLDINYDENFTSFRRYWIFLYKRWLHKKRLNECLNQIKPDITIIMTRREVGFITKMTDGSVKIAENHIDKNRYLNSMNPHFAKLLPKWVKANLRKNTIAALNRLDRFVVLTHEDENAWTELNNKVVIPNPITILPEKQSSCLNKRVIAIGRYEYQKGFDLLLIAWKEVSEKYPDWELHIYGDGILRDKLQIQLVTLGIEKSCFLEHNTSQIEKYYADSSLFVLSSRFEGFGLVIIEAMAHGLPVISFACPCGPREIIKEGIDGLLVECENVKELARKICYLIDNEDVRKVMGDCASENVHQYDIEKIVPLWVQLFDNLVNTKI